MVAEQVDLLSKSTKGAQIQLVLQVLTRALTFAVNQILLRFLSPELLGVSTQLEIYSITVLFFARESLRVAIQRQPDDLVDEVKLAKSGFDKRQQRSGMLMTQSLVNLAYVSIVLGFFFAILLRWLYMRSAAALILAVPYFRPAVLLYGIATFVELLAEPMFVVVQQKSEFRIRATAESVATVSRCVITCLSAIFAIRSGDEIGVLPFALGQMSYATALLLTYRSYVGPIALAQGFTLLPRAVPSGHDHVGSYLYRPLLVLGRSLFVQGILKHVLTQGDVLLMSYLANLEDQGIYALVSNYGGLLARLIFQPIEESSRNYFGKQLSVIEGKPAKSAAQTASAHLIKLLRFYMLLSISVAAVGPTIAPLLLRIVAGQQWIVSGAGDVLGKYCYYVPLLAVNGITEAFVSAAASKTQVDRQTVWMLAFSLGFASAGFFFLNVMNMGAEGLIWANCVNMLMRIFWGVYFIRDFLFQNSAEFDLSIAMPRPASTVISVAAAAILFQLKLDSTSIMVDILRTSSVVGVYILLL